MRQRNANYKDLVNTYLPTLLTLLYEQRRHHELLDILFDWAENVPYLQLEAIQRCDGHQELVALLDGSRVFSLCFSSTEFCHYNIHQRLHSIQLTSLPFGMSFSDDAYSTATETEAPF
ncbi:hypothetical protein [Corynebacterium lubricantis]|uniref:hypothetical protein n=1 Tax=Corynebacterium lubricantis TaxID=541095 RepID=UPI00035E44E3|nr:hypothetical protein [Corynebacterium lubricantis]